jgi:hemoglobin
MGAERNENNHMKRDIESRKDIELLIVRFYEKIKTDSMLGPIFTEVAKVNWEKHLPIMIGFWDNALFYNGTYSGNPMKTHQHLHHIFPLNEEHFKQWLFLFSSSVNELFSGKNAILINQKALNIATVLQAKIFSEHFREKSK